MPKTQVSNATTASDKVGNSFSHGAQSKRINPCKVRVKMLPHPARFEGQKLTASRKKPHTCEYCGEAFAELLNLNKHVEEKHKQSDSILTQPTPICQSEANNCEREQCDMVAPPKQHSTEGVIAITEGTTARTQSATAYTEGAVTNTEGAITDTEGAITDTEGAITDTEGARTDNWTQKVP